MNVDYIHAFTTPIYDVLRKNKYKYDYSSLSLSIWNVEFNDWKSEKGHISTWKKDRN